MFGNRQPLFPRDPAFSPPGPRGHFSNVSTALATVTFCNGWIGQPPEADPGQRDYSSATGLRNVPMPLMVTSMTSPATTGPTPSGVPVATRSPGTRVIIAAM